MICGKNQALESLRGALGSVDGAVTSAQSMFDSAASTINGAIGGVTSAVQSTIGNAVGAVTTSVNSAVASLPGVVPTLPQRDSFIAEFAGLASNLTSDNLLAFNAKWGTKVPNLTQYLSLLKDPTSIDFCKMLPNIKANPVTNEVVTDAPETSPTNVAVEKPAPVEKTVVDNFDRSDIGAAAWTREDQELYQERVLDEIKLVLKPTLDELKAADAEIIALRDDPIYHRIYFRRESGGNLDQEDEQHLQKILEVTAKRRTISEKYGSIVSHQYMYIDKYVRGEEYSISDVPESIAIENIIKANGDLVKRQVAYLRNNAPLQ
jgi:hypothetical protein